MTNEPKHPLSDYPENEVIDYLSVIAFLAGVDGEVADVEVAKLRELCKVVGLSGKKIGQIIGIAEDPTSVDVWEIVFKLKESELKFTLLTDLFFMALADEDYTAEEEGIIREIASQLNVSDEQVTAIRKYVQAIIDVTVRPEPDGGWKELGSDVAAGLASAGVPITAVAVSGSVYGLSAAGITSGLAALGLGLGMTTGIGVVAALGVGSYFGVKYLYNKLTDKKKVKGKVS